MALTPWLGRVPLGIRIGLVTYARNPEPIGVAEFATRVGVSRRTLDRTLTKAGFGGTARFLRAAALLPVWNSLASPRGSVARTAKEIGYKRLKTFQYHTRLIFGIPARTLVKKMGQEEFAERLALATLRAPAPEREP